MRGTFDQVLGYAIQIVRKQRKEAGVTRYQNFLAELQGVVVEV